PGARRRPLPYRRRALALVANRAIAPDSKLAVGDWVTEDVAVPGLTAVDGNNHACGRWTCRLAPTPRVRCGRRCSSPPRTCSTLGSTCSSWHHLDLLRGDDQDEADAVLRRFGHS